jgi:hypothetical protein
LDGGSGHYTGQDSTTLKNADIHACPKLGAGCIVKIEETRNVYRIFIWKPLEKEKRRSEFNFERGLRKISCV